MKQKEITTISPSDTNYTILFEPKCAGKKCSHQCMGIGNAITIGGVALGYITTKICAKYTTLYVMEKNVGYNKSSQEQRGR